MPVVTTTSSGMADVVEDDFTGLLVPPPIRRSWFGDQRLHDDTELRCRLGHEAQSTMRRYTWDQVTDELERTT